MMRSTLYSPSSPNFHQFPEQAPIFFVFFKLADMVSNGSDMTWSYCTISALYAFPESAHFPLPYYDRCLSRVFSAFFSFFDHFSASSLRSARTWLLTSSRFSPSWVSLHRRHSLVVSGARVPSATPLLWGIETAKASVCGFFYLRYCRSCRRLLKYFFLKSVFELTI